MSKRALYIGLFVLLGLLVQFLLHAVVEIFYIKLLLSDFETYGLGLSFNTWFAIHHILTVALLIMGVAVGYQQGRYWWKRLYGKVYGKGR